MIIKAHVRTVKVLFQYTIRGYKDLNYWHQIVLNQKWFIREIIYYSYITYIQCIYIIHRVALADPYPVEYFFFFVKILLGFLTHLSTITGTVKL